MMERWRAYRNGDLGLSRATLSYSVLKETAGQKQLFVRTADSPDDDVDDVVNRVPHSEEIHVLTG
jgi:hypothetical protein